MAVPYAYIILRLNIIVAIDIPDLRQMVSCVVSC